MSNHQVNLTRQEQSLVDQTRPELLARMDRDALKDLQGMLRKAREKNFSLLRREGAARVEAEASRGLAEPAGEKRGEKVTVLDDALARVDERLAAVPDEG